MNIHRGLFRGNITKVSGSFSIIIFFFLINDEVFECIVELYVYCRMFVYSSFVFERCKREMRIKKGVEKKKMIEE